MEHRKVNWHPLLCAAILFFVFNVCLTLIYYSAPNDPGIIMALSSLALGAVFAFLSGRLQQRRGKMPRYRSYLAAFWLLLIAVLAVSTVLFYTSPTQGLLRTVFLWFPQMLVVAFMIPGSIFYFLIACISSKKTAKGD